MELVCDEDYALATVPQAAEDVEQVVDFLRGEDGSRFVEDEKLSVPKQHFDDFYSLLNAHR